MTCTNSFGILKQFNMRFEYAGRLFIRSFIVPKSWSYESMEKYLKLTFNEYNLNVLTHRECFVYSVQSNIDDSKLNDTAVVGEYWNDGLLRDIDITEGDDWDELTFITDSYISTDCFLERVKSKYPKSKEINILYETECLIKNSVRNNS